MSSAAKDAPETGSTGHKRPMLIFFGSSKSGHCRRAEGFLAQVLQRRRNHESFVLHHVEVETRPELAERFQIEHVPTILVVEEKRLRLRLEKPRGCVEIQTALAPWLR